MSGEGHGWFSGQVRACHYLVSLTSEPEGGAGHAIPGSIEFEPGGGTEQTLVHTYVNSQVPHP
jgi:hypothetical protein